MEQVESSHFRIFTGYFFLLWYIVILAVAYSGFFEIFNNFRSRPELSKQNEQKDDHEEDIYEGVTIIRPIKGIDPELYTCLESSLLQNYPIHKLQVLFCIQDSNDESLPILQQLIDKYPKIDCKILIGDDDHYGPNPKVNNLVKGFLSAKYDVLWIMDSNVWASENILKNSIITLNKDLNMGRKNKNIKRPVKLVHHVPLAVSINDNNNNNPYSPFSSANRSKNLGAKLDEMFLHTSHSKFYVSLNNLAIAPCVNGKSNIYRRSDLDQSVKLIPYKDNQFFNDEIVKRDAKYYSTLPGIGHGIKFFARYIGEDNMIGIALWENCQSKTGLTGDVVIQPLGNKSAMSTNSNSVKDYIQRRVRWLRVRKYMVLMATLVEPTTESLICGIYGTYAISTVFFKGQWFNKYWFAFHMIIWVITDYTQYYILINHVHKGHHNLSSSSSSLPPWLVRVPSQSYSFSKWFCIWLVREFLALPIWLIAMFGHEIDWRGKPFKIKKDLTAEEI
ncbi:hypothetical protein G210_1073 [Candida maltosa Xu316]|uniref:Ceramide glucosyltransferase n=1 Tax=Candida maltosa (strain Xu316) TaxID=1245528 RepID=M3HLP9_CANMX|nr:hypothetical protein G210_1073 [Candida maltosa Xu316]